MTAGVPMRVFPITRIKAVTKVVIFICMTMLCMLAFTSASHGQQSSASITGLVKDVTGANITGAQVKLRNLDTNTPRDTVSNGAGNYTFLNVPAGRYTMEFSSQGFQAQIVAAFELNVNQTLSLDVVLKVG